jgi:integrase
MCLWMRWPSMAIQNPQKCLHGRLHESGVTVGKIKLTAPKVEAFKCPADKAQAFLWDSDTPGLGLRATPSGAKAFVFQSRFQGGSIRTTIGNPKHWPLNSRTDRVGPGGKVLQLGAREKARQMQSIIDSGRDPRIVEAETTAIDVATRVASKANAITLGEAWALYVEERKPNWGDAHYKDHLQIAHRGGQPRKRSKAKTKPGAIAVLLDEKLRGLTAERFQSWAAREVVTRPARARLAFRLLTGFYSWCAAHQDYREAVVMDALKSRKLRESLGAPVKRMTALQREQLPAWFRAVRAMPNEVISAYLQFMLLAGPRPSEPLSLRWTDLNFQWRMIAIRDKVEGERVIGMTPYIAQLLNRLPRRTREVDGKVHPNEWVFSSPTSKSGALVDPGNAHDLACMSEGLPKITLQGLRRSFATLSEWVEVPAGIAAQIQGHAPQGVREQNYIRRPVDLLRSWHEKIEAWMLEQAGIQFMPTVQPIPLADVKGGA